MSQLSDKRLTAALVAKVHACFANGDLDNLTVKKVRAAAERELGLEDGWFREHAEWSGKSKEAINSESANSLPPVSSPEMVKAEKKHSSPQKYAAEKSLPISTKKRKSDSGDLSSQATKKPKSSSSKASATREYEKAGVNSDSELSVVLDLTPKKRKSKSDAKKVDQDAPEQSKASNRKSRPKDGAAASKDSKKEPKSKNTTEETPLSESEERIKELQSQLVKCGVRKIWQFELKEFDTDARKIRHLKGMLEDVGMTGRFSTTKAKEIKERRELQQDLDAVTAGEKTWGHKSDDEDGRPKRKIAKGLAELDWLADDSESD